MTIDAQMHSPHILPLTTIDAYLRSGHLVWRNAADSASICRTVLFFMHRIGGRCGFMFINFACAVYIAIGGVCERSSIMYRCM